MKKNNQLSEKYQAEKLTEVFTRYKDTIEECLRDYIGETKKNIQIPWHEDFLERFSELLLKGKMIRGSLALLISDFYGDRAEKDIVFFASALEVFQTSFLIHDDIIDNDDFRRGSPSLLKQYRDLFVIKEVNDAVHTARDFAICSGDLAFFWAYGLLSGIKNKKYLSKILKLVSDELTVVGLGQMQDIYFGKLSFMPTFNEILKVYENKTARYTFCLPFQGSGLYFNLPKVELEKLFRLGRLFGLIFQAVDDGIGIFGKIEETGKQSSSDIRERKKTAYLYYLFQSIKQREKETIQRNFFSGGKATREQTEKIKKMIEDSGAREKVEKQIILWQKEAKKVIKKLNLSEDKKGLLYDFSQYLTDRKK